MTDRKLLEQSLAALRSASILLPANYKNKWIGLETIESLETELVKSEQESVETELRRLHQVNQKLIELAEALNATLAEVCSANPNLEISCEHDERIKSAVAKLKEQS